MKALLVFIGTLIFLLLRDVHQARAATLKCTTSKPIVELAGRQVHIGNTTEEDYDDDVTSNNNKEDNKNSLKKIFHNIQCTLEKAKPWVAELQQEAKRLEEAAKLLGLGILNSFGQFVDKLVEETVDNKTVNTKNSTLLNENEIIPNSTEIANEELSPYLCPEGFVADQNGICERID